jgi:hypothetical protein
MISEVDSIISHLWSLFTGTYNIYSFYDQKLLISTTVFFFRYYCISSLCKSTYFLKAIALTLVSTYSRIYKMFKISKDKTKLSRKPFSIETTSGDPSLLSVFSETWTDIGETVKRFATWLGELRFPMATVRHLWEESILFYESNKDLNGRQICVNVYDWYIPWDFNSSSGKALAIFKFCIKRRKIDLE